MIELMSISISEFVIFDVLLMDLLCGVKLVAQSLFIILLLSRYYVIEIHFVNVIIKFQWKLLNGGCVLDFSIDIPGSAQIQS